MTRLSRPATDASSGARRHGHHFAAIPRGGRVADTPTIGGPPIASLGGVPRTTHRRSPRPPTPERRASELRGKALRSARRGEWRKAALSLRELVALEDRASDWVRLGHALAQAGREGESLAAYRQGLFRHRRDGAPRRARTVARLILAACPGDPTALRAERQAA
jgi:hypothetical protein